MTFKLQRGSSPPLVMGILNLTPDSFSDGGAYLDPQAALDRANELHEQGADWLDIGAESTRPGAAPLTWHEDWSRLEPALSLIRQHSAIKISVDTYHPETARRAAAIGVDMINDVYAGRYRDIDHGADPKLSTLDVAAKHGIQICLMHMQGTPSTMQAAPVYGDVVAEVMEFLQERVNAAIAAGVSKERIWIDPGFGFGKSLDHNRALMANLDKLAEVAPMLVGLSRKRSLAQLSGSQDPRRLPESIAAALLAAERGAAMVRVHDVSETVRALQVWAGLR